MNDIPLFWVGVSPKIKNDEPHVNWCATAYPDGKARGLDVQYYGEINVLNIEQCKFKLYVYIKKPDDRYETVGCGTLVLGGIYNRADMWRLESAHILQTTAVLNKAITQWVNRTTTPIVNP